MQKSWIFLFALSIFFNIPSFAESLAKPSLQSSAAKAPTKKTSEPKRRAKPAPFDSIFPSSEYLGPTIGVPNTDPIYPLTKWFWGALPGLKEKDIRIYGWVNPSYNKSSSRNSNFPLSYQIVPNHVELDQLVLRLDRSADTVQTEHIDWGFRLSNIYGIDYRFTTAQGYFSRQLLRDNNLYGYDAVEAYGQLYFPALAQGMVVTIGRYISAPDIEAQLSPQNYLVTHSIMFTFDTYTQTGINAAIKFNDNWTALVGINSGSDVAPWTSAAHPTLLAMLRWVSPSNNDSLWGGINSVNSGRFKGFHDDLQQFNLTWTHRFNEGFLITTEAYYIYQYDGVLGGTCNFGPVRSFGSGGGCGPLIPGLSDSMGIVNNIEFKVFEKNFISFRTDYFDDYQGQRSGFATPYLSLTLGLTHSFSDYLFIRPELRYERAYTATPYDNGTKGEQKTALIDFILRF